MTRSGCRAGTRSSKSTYENNDPVTASDPRIAASRADSDTESDLRYPVPAAFFNGLLEIGEDGAHEGGETGLALALEALGGEDGGEAR
jgi:hypothetical protein